MADEDYLGGAAKGAATGASMGGPWGALAGAGIGALSPFVAKGLGSLFGLDQPSEGEKAAIGQLKGVAQGAQTPAQLMLAAQRAKTQQQLASMAARGTAQQQAGQTRMAMQMAPEIQAQQAAQMAAIRSQEQRQAQEALAGLQANIGQRQRQYERGLVGAGLQGGMAMAANAFLGGGGGGGAATPAATGADEALKKSLGITSSSYGGEATPTSADYAKELGFSQTAPSAPSAAPAAAMTPTQASDLQTAVQQAQARSPWESLYKGPAMPTAEKSAQQQADEGMMYRGMAGGAEGQAAAQKYFAMQGAPTSTVQLPEGAESRGSFGATQNAYDFNRGNIERQVGALPKSLGAQPVQYSPAAPSAVTRLGQQVAENQGINAAIGNAPASSVGIPMRRKLGFGYGY